MLGSNTQLLVTGMALLISACARPESWQSNAEAVGPTPQPEEAAPRNGRDPSPSVEPSFVVTVPVAAEAPTVRLTVEVPPGPHFEALPSAGPAIWVGRDALYIGTLDDHGITHSLAAIADGGVAEEAVTGQLIGPLFDALAERQTFAKDSDSARFALTVVADRRTRLTTIARIAYSAGQRGVETLRFATAGPEGLGALAVTIEMRELPPPRGPLGARFTADFDLRVEEAGFRLVARARPTDTAPGTPSWGGPGPRLVASEPGVCVFDPATTRATATAAIGATCPAGGAPKVLRLQLAHVGSQATWADLVAALPRDPSCSLQLRIDLGDNYELAGSWATHFPVVPSPTFTGCSTAVTADRLLESIARRAKTLAGSLAAKRWETIRGVDPVGYRWNHDEGGVTVWFDARPRTAATSLLARAAFQHTDDIVDCASEQHRAGELADIRDMVLEVDAEGRGKVNPVSEPWSVLELCLAKRVHQWWFPALGGGPHVFSVVVGKF